MSDLTTTPAETDTPSMNARLGAEVLGTFWLVLAGCGSAILWGGASRTEVALSFGLAVLTGAYALAHISGAHFNPAVTVGLATAKRFAWKDVPVYVIAQIVGATLAGVVLLLIAHGVHGFDADGHFATNGYGDYSPGHYTLWSVIITEILFTAVFVWVILGATAKRASAGFAALAIGLCLTLIHLVTLIVDGTSVNPARSLGVAWFGGSHGLQQVWVFLLAPLVGGVLAGITHAFIVGEQD